MKLLDKVSFIVNNDDKIAFVGENELAQTTLFKILMGELEPDEGSVKWGSDRHDQLSAEGQHCVF